VGRERLPPWAMFAAAAVTAAVACRNGPVAPADGGREAGVNDGPSPLSLEIAVTGCTSYDPTGARCDNGVGAARRCTGTPPLTLSFAPVGSLQLQQFTWTFGDGTPTVNERAPSHTYLLPGCYEVTLVGVGNADVGTVKPPPQVIQVDGQPIGAPCDVDGQCAGGLECACAPGSGCGPAFTHGVCTRPCETTQCCDTPQCLEPRVCASLAFAGGADAGPPVRRPRCVAPCASAGDCAVGFACPTLASGTAPSSSWVRGCLPIGAQRDLGEPCRDENETLDADSCGTGVCANIGALGVCSANCDATHPCPSGAICARLRDRRDFCLAPCTSDAECARDPLLSCVGGLDSGGTDTSVCAPRSCATDDECAPSGRCDNAVCVRR
jgi:hypothetical protein